MRSACTLTSVIAPAWSHTTMPSGAASTSSRKSMSAGSGMVVGDPEAEYGAGRGVLDPDAAAVGLDGELAEREAQAAAGARAPLLGLREALEHPGPQLRGHAGPRVRDADLDAGGVDRRRHRDGRVLG